MAGHHDRSWRVTEDRWISLMESHIASHASHMSAPSPGSFAAHIQLAEHLTSPRWVIGAHTRLVSASATASRPIADGETSPLIGCSPTAVAAPVVSVWVCASSNVGERDVGGPTPLPTSPVADRSTLLVEALRADRWRPQHRSSAEATLCPRAIERRRLARRALEGEGLARHLGETKLDSRSTGVEPSVESSSTTRPSPPPARQTTPGRFSHQIALKAAGSRAAAAARSSPGTRRPRARAPTSTGRRSGSAHLQRRRAADDLEHVAVAARALVVDGDDRASVAHLGLPRG